MEFNNMDKKYLIIIAIAIVAILVIGAFAMGVFDHKKTTPFSTEFMSGAFAGQVSQLNSTNESFICCFEDSTNNITYNLTTLDNASALMEIYRYQGILGPEHRKINGNEWNIYFSKAIANNNGSNNTVGIVICEVQTEHQGYVINIIFNDLSKVNFTLGTYSESYTDFVEPLLNSINLTETDNFLHINEEFGLSESQFSQQIQLIMQSNRGNYSNT